MQAFALTEEQRTFSAHVHDIAVAELLPLNEQSIAGHVDRPLLAAMGRHGLLGHLFGISGNRPAGEGTSDLGDGGSRVTAAAMNLCLLRETLAAVSTEIETALALQGLGSYPFLLFGNQRTIECWRDDVVAGTAVAAFAL